MSLKKLPQARLLNSIPKNRFRLLVANTNSPKKGDIVKLDQGFESTDGKPMVLAYCEASDGTLLYEAEVYECELGS